MTNTKHYRRCLAALITLLFLAQPLHSAEDAAVEQRFNIGYYHLGPQEITEALRRQNFENRLSGRPGIVAEEVSVHRLSDWYGAPEGQAPEQWINLVSVVFGKRQNWLALQMAGPEGTVSRAAWSQAVAIVDSTKYSYINSVPPGPDSVANLTMIELAAAFGQLVERPERPAGPIVGITVEPWRDVPQSSALGSLLGGESQDVPPSQPADGQALTAVQALALAAAWQAGLSPRRGDAPSTLKIELSRSVETYGMKLTWTHEGSSRTVIRSRIPETMLYHGLQALLRWAMAWGDDVHDVVQLEPEGMRLLHTDGRLIAYVLDAHADAYSVRTATIANALPAWEIPKADRSQRLVTLGKSPEGNPALYVYDPAVQPIDLGSGRIFASRMGRASQPWGFIALSEEEALTAYETGLRRGSRGNERWSFTAPMPINAGPLLVGDTVVAGSDDGSIFGVGLEDGGERWRSRIAGTPAGPIQLAGERLLVRTWEGQLAALQASDGRVLWERTLGDALSGEPWILGDRVIVGWGNGRLGIFSLADGEPFAEAQHPRLLRTFTPIPVEGRPLVAGVELSGTVAFYSVPELQLVRSVALGTRPVHQPLYAAEAPVRWGTGDPLLDLVPQLLISDFNGLIYCVAIPK